MTDGLKTTFQFLAGTDNEAAGPLLAAGLDSPRAEIRQSSLSAILARRFSVAHRAVVERLHTLDDDSRKLIEANPSRLTPALREAILDGDRQVCENGCKATVWLRQYDLVPALLNALEEPDNPYAEVLADALREIIDLLCEELSGPRDYTRRRDPQLIRHQVLNSLELSLGRFSKHHRQEVLEAFVQLAPCDNLVLRQILQDPHHSAFVPLVDCLAKSDRPSTVRLLLGFLDDPKAPSAVLSVASKRADLKFVECLLRKVGRQPSAAVAQNLKRIESVAWVRSGAAVLDQLDELTQPAAARLVVATAMPRTQAFSVIEHLLRHGKTPGRRAAAEILDEFQGAEANAWALRALADPDPEVRAAILPQLRRRGIPGSLARLIEALDSPHTCVRNAARKSLGEFTFRQFLGNFDLLEEETRRSTGELVKKVDPHAVPQLRVELMSHVRSRRLRALKIARLLSLAPQVESTLARLLEDDDHLVRVEAATALEACHTLESRDSLLDALSDRSVAVQEAARKSLLARGERLPERHVVMLSSEAQEPGS